MGAYRLLLSILVLLSHLRVAVDGRNIGVVAVVSFFLLSGYVMTALVDRHYSRPDRIPAFYLDRALRLFPQYLFYFAATLVLIHFRHPAGDFVSRVTVAGLLANVAMLPMNFYVLFPNCLIIPQAWSLGLESQFYLLIPAVLIYRARAVVFVASFTLFWLAYLGILDTDLHGYRMLTGTMFLFLYGSYLRSAAGKFGRRALACVYAALCLMLIAVLTGIAPDNHFNVEVLVGAVIGVPVVAILRRMSFGKIEEFLGNISYGVFLNQFFLMWLFQGFGIDVYKPANIVGLIIASMALSWITYELVERPAIRLRHALRRREGAPVRIRSSA